MPFLASHCGSYCFGEEAHGCPGRSGPPLGETCAVICAFTSGFPPLNPSRFFQLFIPAPIAQPRFSFFQIYYHFLPHPEIMYILWGGNEPRIPKWQRVLLKLIVPFLT